MQSAKLDLIWKLAFDQTCGQALYALRTDDAVRDYKSINRLVVNLFLLLAF